VSPSLRILLMKEWRELRRDRRVLFVSLIVPVLLYPALMGGSQRLQARHEDEVQQRRIRVATSLIGGPLFEKLDEDTTLSLSAVASDSLADAVRSRRVDAAIHASADLDSVTLWSATAREDSREAVRRLREDLDDLREEFVATRLDDLGASPDALDVVVLRSRSVATAVEEGGARAGRVVIYLLLMILYMAGSVLATDMVAGEKERGTLETLFLAPVARGDIARAKVLVVSVGTAITGLLCLGGLLLSYQLGWVRADDGSMVHLQMASFGGLALLTLPVGALIGAVLMGISTWARSLKEAQTTMLPVMLLLLVPALLSMQQSIEMSALVAIIPVANVAFLMRDLLAGQLQWSWVILSLVATVAYLVLVLRRVTAMLGREELVLGFAHEPLLAPTESGRRRALHLSMATSLLLYFYVGQWLQARWSVVGLVISLWGLLPLFVAMGLSLTRGWAAMTQLLSLRAPRPRMLVGAVFLGWGAILPLVGGLQELQNRVLPSPTLQSPMAESLAELGTPLALLLLALSPAIVEELLYRGFALGVLRSTGVAARGAIVTSALYFALMHMSVHRFLLTFVLGVLMGFVVYRTRSIFVSMLLHLTYNASLVWGLDYFSRREPPIDPRGILAWVLSVGLLVTGFLLIRAQDPLRATARDVV
jgi:sodium transport system permease protein